jgi:hypothetical protein
MIKLDASQIQPNFFELQINKYKEFYKVQLLKHKNQRIQLLSELNPLLTKLQSYQGKVGSVGNEKYESCLYEVKTYLNKYWGAELVSYFNKKVSYAKSKFKANNDDNFFFKLLGTFAALQEENSNRAIAEYNFKLNFLVFLRDCLSNQGLHKYIYQRDDRIYKRFNLLVCYKEEKKEYITSRPLLSQHELESDYLIPYYKKKPIFIDGKIIKASIISRINITSTLLWHDDEIELFGHVKGFSWNKDKKEKTAFSKSCFDETNIYLKNPNAESPKAKFKNNSITYIEQSRIDELASIKSKNFDLSKLIALCNELNQCSTIRSSIAVASLQRTIINHVPPIFGFENFGQVVAQYNTGKSVKKNFEHLLNSMKPISDHHLHSPVTKSDSLPNMTQVDFSNDLDVLLAEICKILKS